MRIIAGQFRGTALAALGKGDSAAHLRPTSDRVRESLFNLLASSHGDPVPDARVLDLFAGTGALGLEAMSRGANFATFVDDGRKSLSLLSENIRKTRTEAVTQVLRRSALKLPPCAAAPATLVFLDPPYGKGLGQKALHDAATKGWIASGACIVWEESTAMEAPDGFTISESRRYGDTFITLMEFQGQS